MYNIPYTVNTETITLESILSSHSKYLSFKKQLRQHHILFLDQLTIYDNSCLLDWKHISPRIHKIPKGRKPLWFITLEDITTNHSYYRTLHNYYQLPKINHFSYTTGYFSKHSKPWLITTLQDQIIIGKARRQPTPSGQILITHWHCNIELHATQLYPTPSITTKLCTGCNLNSNLITSKCTTFIPINLATKFFGNFNTQNRQLNLNANYLDLLYSIAIRHPTQIPNTTNIYIPASLIPPVFDNSDLTDTLQSIANLNYNKPELHFYTDGSVIQAGTSQCSIGIGWVLVQNNNILYTFQAQTKFWPCSFKAEITAILSAIITAPRNYIVHIYTDSQSAISKYNSTNLTSLKLSFINTPYHSLWYTLINFINSYNIQLIFHKVAVHQDNKFNNLADNLACNHFNLPYLLFNPQNYYNPNYTLQLDNYPIELPIRRCIRTI